MTTIEQIKAALKAHIAEAEAATHGPLFGVSEQGRAGILWTLFTRGPFQGIRVASCAKADDATFIAHARTMSPAACKCLLLAIEGLEELIVPCACLADSAQFSEGYNEGWLRASDKAAGCLESIRQEWHNLTTK